MGLLIDTNIWVMAERGIDVALERWAEHGASYISAVTASELLQGVERANTPERRNRRAAWVEAFLAGITVVDVDLPVARIHARMLGALPKNITAGSHDALIAATAAYHGYAVLTKNAKDFKIFAGVQVLEWMPV